jgi:hypothetical protein
MNRIAAQGTRRALAGEEKVYVITPLIFVARAPPPRKAGISMSQDHQQL